MQKTEPEGSPTAHPDYPMSPACLGASELVQDHTVGVQCELTQLSPVSFRTQTLPPAPTAHGAESLRPWLIVLG